MKVRLIAIALIMGFIATACGGSGVKPQMTRGEKLFRSNCNTCHNLPKAKNHTDEEWPALVNRYANFTKLDPIQRLEIIEFLQSEN